jgi:hypothetical protein
MRSQAPRPCFLTPERNAVSSAVSHTRYSLQTCAGGTYTSCTAGLGSLLATHPAWWPDMCSTDSCLSTAGVQGGSVLYKHAQSLSWASCWHCLGLRTNKQQIELTLSCPCPCARASAPSWQLSHFRSAYESMWHCPALSSAAQLLSSSCAAVSP